MEHIQEGTPSGWKYFSERGDIQVYTKGDEYMLYSGGRVLLKKKNDNVVIL